MRSRTRAGFTLIELMVAMTLTLVIMAILSQAFVLALETFAGLKGIGDMQQLSRTASVILRSDVSNAHFEGNRRLSDPNIISPNARIQAGFFVLSQGSVPANPTGAVPFPPYCIEGNDQNGVASHRAVDHVLYMTTRRKGNRQEDFFTTGLVGNPNSLGLFFNVAEKTAYNIPFPQLAEVTLTPAYTGGNQAFYSSQWAEVAYYLERTGSTEEPNIPTSILGTPTYALMRAQYVMVPDSTTINDNTNAIGNGLLTTFAGLSCNMGATNLKFYSPSDVASVGVGNRMFAPATFSTTNTRLASTASLVMPQVLSFQVKVMPNNWVSGQAYAVNTLVSFNGIAYRCIVAPTNNQPPTNTGFWVSTGAPFADLPPANLIYDTTQFGVAGANNFGLKAIQITLRIWDFKTRQTRQTSILCDL